MKLVEFTESMRKLSNQWGKNNFGEERSKIFYRKYGHLADGVFENIVTDLIFEGGMAPKGSTFDEKINSKRKEYYNLSGNSKISYEGCAKCKHSGQFFFENSKKQEQLFSCDCKLGRKRHTDNNIPNWRTACQDGFYSKNLSSRDVQIKSSKINQPEGFSSAVHAFCCMYDFAIKNSQENPPKGFNFAKHKIFKLKDSEAFQLYEEWLSGKVGAIAEKCNKIYQSGTIVRTIAQQIEDKSKFTKISQDPFDDLKEEFKSA